MDTTGLQITIERENCGTCFPCCLCGRPVDLPFASAVAYRDGKRLGDVCPDCLGTGPAYWPTWADVVAEASDYSKRGITP